MPRFLASFYRITSRAGFLFIALILGLLLWVLPSLLNLDAFRPRVTEVLVSTFRCKAIVGGITGQLIPVPGLVIAPVVLLEDTATPRVLASVRAVRMSFSIRSLLMKKFEIKDVRFLRPRFIAHRVRDSSGRTRWVMLTLPKAPSSQQKVRIEDWEVRNGAIEIWDQTQTPTAKWVAAPLSGSFLVGRQTGALAGRALQLGSRASIAVHYNGAASFPVQARLSAMDLDVLQFLLPHFVTLEGPADLSIQTRFLPVTDIRGQMDQPSGAGRVEISIQNQTRGHWRWSVLGKQSRLKGTAFAVPEWSAKGDGAGLAMEARGTTADGGTAEVSWTKPAAAGDAALEVTAGSVTIRQVLQIFKLESKTPPASGAWFNPCAYESWRISQGSMKALIHGTTSFEVLESGIDAAGMHLDLDGTFDLAKAGPEGHIQGELSNVPMASVLESFFTAPSAMTGTGAAHFDLSFPLSGAWVQGLSGPLQVDVKGGVIKAFKTVYRIIAVLNLSNYLRLRFPNITAKGIEFSDLSGHLAFQNGVLSTEDLFLKSPNVNIGVRGTLDVPGRRVKAALRLEMLRFLEDILKEVPITHWIFKKPNKILFPLVVTLEGPWTNLDVR